MKNIRTSDTARAISTFQYTYPEFVGAASNADVQARVRQLYNFGGSAPSRRDIVASLRNTKHYDWSVRIRFAPGELGRPFAVHCFLGDPPVKLSQSMQAETYVGSAFAFSGPGMGDMQIQSFVQLAETLAKRGLSSTLSPVIITPYLTSNLKWRLIEVRYPISVGFAWLTA